MFKRLYKTSELYEKTTVTPNDAYLFLQDKCASRLPLMICERRDGSAYWWGTNKTLNDVFNVVDVDALARWLEIYLNAKNAKNGLSKYAAALNANLEDVPELEGYYNALLFAKREIYGIMRKAFYKVAGRQPARLAEWNLLLEVLDYPSARQPWHR